MKKLIWWCVSHVPGISGKHFDWSIGGSGADCYYFIVFVVVVAIPCRGEFCFSILAIPNTTCALGLLPLPTLLMASSRQQR